MQEAMSGENLYMVLVPSVGHVSCKQSQLSCLLYMGHLEHLRITTMKGISKLVT